MKVVKDAISSKYFEYDIDEDIIIYEGRFCIYLDKKYKCSGIIYYKMIQPMSINFEASIINAQDEENLDLDLDYDNAVLEVYGYKPVYITVNSINKDNIDGFINDSSLKSKNTFVEYVDFNIINLDQLPGKLINFESKLFAGRIEFDLNDYKIIIDKRYDYRKELNEELKSRSGNIITHVGRIIKKDNSKFKTNNIENIINRISASLSFMCGRYVDICLVSGYFEGKNVYRLWRDTLVTPFNFVPTWSDTISNHYNIEKYMSLMCKKLEDVYYELTIKHIIDWYIESLNNITLENNIISIQIALETLSYIVLVELDGILDDEKFDENSTSKNIKMLLDTCNIKYGQNELYLFDDWIRSKFDDGVDLVIYFRNKIVHPTRKGNIAALSVDDMWNIIQIGTRYVELALLYIIGYKGEYSNRLKYRSYGEVELVPWNV